MPSTFTGSGIELIADGEQSGVWGQTTNDNLQIINRLVSEAGSIALSGTTHTLTIADGSLSDGQYGVLVFGGSPSGTNTVTVSPNDAKRIFIVKNGTSESVVLTQGSGGNVTIPASAFKIVYTDGGGAGAEVVDVTSVAAFTTVNATTLDTTNIEVTNIKAKDGTASATIADSTGVMTVVSSVLTTTDINGGTIDGTTIGGASAAAGTFTTATATTLDTTNIEVTNIKAKDGTAAGSIADATGVVTLASSVLTTTDINGGTIDGTVIGGSTPAAISGTTGSFSGSGFPVVINSTNNNLFKLALQDTAATVGYIGASSAAAFAVGSSAAAELFRVSSSGLLTNQIGAVFNESGADSDFRVESDTNTHMLFVDASANAVGIGLSNPGVPLHVKGPTNGNVMIVDATGTSANYIFDVRDDGTSVMRVDPSGNLLVGGTTAGNAGTVSINVGNAGATAGGLQMWAGTAQTSFVQFGDESGTAANHYRGYIAYAHASDSMQFGTASTERMRIDSAGTLIHKLAATFNEDGADADFRVESDSQTHALFVDAGTNSVGIADSAPGASKTFTDTTVATNFFVNSNVATNGPMFQYDKAGVFLGLQNDVGSGTRYFISFGETGTRLGDITSNGSVMAYGGTSDYRLKTNVQPMTGAIDRVKALNPVTFDWISSGISSEGFIAHELQSVIPDAATGTKDEVNAQGKPVYQQVDPRHVVSVLTAALQEAIAKIETLEARIAALETA
jgi:hypothetical protein